MKNDSQVVSVNLGRRKKVRIGKKLVETGIFKHPVTDIVKVTEQGLVNDVVANTTHHGGRDQAIYLYSGEDYQWWSKDTQSNLLPGTFGENLTLSSFMSSSLRIGDRFQINDVLLEVTSARIPCATLAARMEDSGFVKKFRRAQRPGAYARVLQEGELQTGDDVKLKATSEDYPTVLEIFELWYSKERDSSLIQKALKAPIAERARAAMQSWLND